MQRSATNKLRSLPAKKAAFVEPMECLSVARLPEGSQWLWAINLDGYRALAVKSGSVVTLFSRRRKSLNKQFPYIVERLADLPDGTVVDGELVAIDDSGRPDFHLLQNFRAEAARIHYYIFDVLCRDCSPAGTRGSATSTSGGAMGAAADVLLIDTMLPLGSPADSGSKSRT
jgi:ATP-dependent DNA ligase